MFVGLGGFRGQHCDFLVLVGEWSSVVLVGEVLGSWVALLSLRFRNWEQIGRGISAWLIGGAEGQSTRAGHLCRRSFVRTMGQTSSRISGDGGSCGDEDDRRESFDARRLKAARWFWCRPNGCAVARQQRHLSLPAKRMTKARPLLVNVKALGKTMGSKPYRGPGSRACDK
ncbi:MAG: hypothetical protein FWD57_12845 [Polyangiaceae bacterium]|nr:hypothetical protein [Polyangiaceae bacterium]